MVPLGDMWEGAWGSFGSSIIPVRMHACVHVCVCTSMFVHMCLCVPSCAALCVAVLA